MKRILQTAAIPSSWCSRASARMARRPKPLHRLPRRSPPYKAYLEPSQALIAMNDTELAAVEGGDVIKFVWNSFAEGSNILFGTKLVKW